MDHEKENYDVAEELKNVLPPRTPADDADEVLGEIMGKGGSYNESFHSMMYKYLGADPSPASPEDLDTGRIFRRHVDEELEAYISADGKRTAPDPEADARIRKKLASSVREVYSIEPSSPAVRPTFTAEGAVVYPTDASAGERVVYDADWEKQAKQEAGRIDELRRSGVTSGGRSLGDTFRFVGKDGASDGKTAAAPADAGGKAGRRASYVGHEDFLTPVIGKAPDEAAMKKEVRAARPVAGSADEGLTSQEKELVDHAVLEMFTSAGDPDREFREKWADTVSKAQKRKEMLAAESKKENARLRSEEKLREKEKQVAENEYKWVSSGRQRPSEGLRTTPEVRFAPRKKTGVPDESEMVERILVDDTPEEMIYKKGKGEKLAFSLKSRFSKEGVKRFFRNAFPNKSDPGSEKARKTFRLLMFTVMVGAIAVFIVFFTPWLKMRNDNISFKDEIASLENLTPEQQAELWAKIKAEYPDVDFPEGMHIKFAYRYAINQDVVGRVAVPELGLDTVLVQADDDAYYLYRDMYKQESRYGTPYVKSDSSMGREGLSKNVIIYGHNTHDGLIFNILEEYTKPETVRQHPIITLDTLFGTAKFKVFAVMLTNANPDDDNGNIFDYLYSNFYSGNHFMYVVNGMKERSLVHTGVDVNENDNLLTLYTCYRYQFDSGRLVIVARQLREGESESIDGSNVWQNTGVYLPAAYYGTKSDTPSPAPANQQSPAASPEAQPDPQPAETPASPNTPGAPEAPAQQDDETPQQEAPEETPQEEGGQEEPDAGYDEPENDAQD